jgi:hypothetical protein
MYWSMLSIVDIIYGNRLRENVHGLRNITKSSHLPLAAQEFTSYLHLCNLLNF